MKTSVVYLFLPLVVFTVGWLKPWISIPLLVCIVGSVGMMLKNSGNGVPARPDAGNLRFTLGVAAITVVFAIFCGLCPSVSWVPQSTDYFKHNLILGDLIERPWPVRYPGEHGGQFLCYGLGYYLLPASIAKVLGTASVGITGFLWATLGLFLFFYGLGRGFARNPKLGIVVVLLCSGLGAFWYLIKSGVFHSLLPATATGIEPGNQLMLLGLYTANMDSFTRILYQPQHGVVAWLGGILIYDLVIVRRRWTEAASVLAATFFWSPLTTVGLAFIGVTAMIVDPEQIRLRPAIHLAAAIAVTVMLMAYYLPHVPIAETRFIWTWAAGASWVPWYLLFLLLFVGIPLSSIWWLDRKHPYLGPLKPVVIGMCVVLVLSPIYIFGQSGDMRLQLSGPAFLFIAIAMAKGLIEVPVPQLSAPYLYLAAVFLAGMAFPVLHSASHLIAGHRTDYRIATLRKNHLHSLMDLTFPGYEITSQYLGRDDAMTAEWILKPNR